MPRVNEQMPIVCPFSAAMDFVERFFKARPSLVVEGAGIFRVRVTPSFELTADRSDVVRRHDALKILWKPAPHEKLLPSFHALITLRPRGRNTEMRIRGYYRPPLGRFGWFFDRVVGSLIARQTIRTLSRQIKDYVESGWAAERASYPSLTALNTQPASETSAQDRGEPRV